MKALLAIAALVVLATVIEAHDRRNDELESPPTQLEVLVWCDLYKDPTVPFKARVVDGGSFLAQERISPQWVHTISGAAVKQPGGGYRLYLTLAGYGECSLVSMFGFQFDLELGKPKSIGVIAGIGFGVKVLLRAVPLNTQTEPSGPPAVAPAPN